MDTVGRNKKAIAEYIRNQLQEDIARGQLSSKEYIDPFTGEPVEKGKCVLWACQKGPSP